VVALLWRVAGRVVVVVVLVHLSPSWIVRVEKGAVRREEMAVTGVANGV